MSELKQINTLAKGKGIQYLLDAASEILRNPIALFDANYALLAYTPVVTDDPLWNELVSTGTFTMATQEFFANEGFTEAVTNADNLVILKSATLKYERVLAHIYNRDRVKVGNLIMVGCNTPLKADDLIAFNAFADKITNEISNDEHFAAYGKSYQSALIVKILDGDITSENAGVYMPHVQILYEGFKDYWYLAVVDVGQNGARHDRLVHIRNLLESRHKSFKFAIYSDYIIIIMSSKDNTFHIKQVLGKDDDFFKQNNIFAGISSSFENLYELRKYYDEAVTALKSGIEMNSSQRVFLYGNARVPGTK